MEIFNLTMHSTHFIYNFKEWMFNDTPAQKTDRLLGVRKR